MDPMQVMMQMMKQGKGGGKWGNGSQDTLARIHKMDDEVKVYVEGLPESAKWRELQKHCETAGHKPVLCEVTRGGKAVLAFKDAAGATEAIAGLDQTTLDGNTITADVWTKKEPSGDKPEGDRKKSWSNDSDKKSWSNDSDDAWQKMRGVEWDRKVYVAGLPSGANDQALEKHFADAGHKPESCAMMGAGKGVVAFSDASAAKDAIAALNQTTMDGSTITTDEWTKSSKPGGWSGKGNGNGGFSSMNMGNMNPMQAMMMAMMMGGKGGNSGGSGGCGGGGNQAPQDLGATCAISNVPDGITIDEFKENLKQAGNVKSAKFAGTGKAFVSFASVSEAKQCVSMFHGCEIGANRLQVHLGKQ